MCLVLLEFGYLFFAFFYFLFHLAQFLCALFLLFVRKFSRRLFLCLYVFLNGLCRRSAQLQFFERIYIFFLQEFVNTTNKLTHLTSSKFVNFRYQAIQEVSVVTHYNHCAVKCTNGFFQHILGTHIQVVGRFVQNKEIDRFKQEFYHRQTATLATTKDFDLFIRSLTAKHECAENISNLQSHVTLGHMIYCIKNGQFAVEHLRLVLGIISDFNIMS